MTNPDLFTERVWRIILGGCATFAFIVAMWLSSCNTVKRDTKRLAAIDLRNPTVPAKFCSDKYPPQDSVSIVKEYLQGEEVVVLDTVVNDNYINDSIIITKYITKTVRVTDTFRDVKYIQLENKARIVVLEDEKKKCGDSLIIMTDSRNDWRMWCYILGGAWVLFIGFKLVRRWV